jgi:recombination protein RecA
VRCRHQAEHALKAADLLIQGGGFGLVAMDLGDTRVETARRISLTSWFRLRRAVEHTPAILLALSRRSNAKTCASLAIECRRERVLWSGTHPGRLLRGISTRDTSTERSNACSPVFTARAI